MQNCNNFFDGVKNEIKKKILKLFIYIKLKINNSFLVVLNIYVIYIL